MTTSHLVPVMDGMDHDETDTGVTCPCGPDVEPYGPDLLVMHQYIPRGTRPPGMGDTTEDTTT
jgi:hypothetical protein